MTRRARFSDADAARRISGDFAHYCMEGLPSEEVTNVIEACLPGISAGDIVVIDCFYRLCPDSNDPTEVAHIFNTVKAWAKQTQAAWIIVDHFRKAGADKARDRFAGSFIKQAGPGCLVAIEVRKGGVFEIQIDARSFHGDPRVWCRWDSEGYRFVRIAEADIAAAKEEASVALMCSWLSVLWTPENRSVLFKTKAAAEKWGITQEGARGRIGKLQNGGFVENTSGNRAIVVGLTALGLELIQQPTGKPS
jgi:hypothetical protein